LPENYDDTIKTSLVYSSYKDYYLDSRAAPYLIEMLEAAKKDGMDLIVVSAYRSCAYQQQNFDNSLNERINKGMTYDEAYKETAANVAFPGKSEHNAGVAADIMTSSYTSMDDDGFKNTPEYKWLQDNAYKYGFILRYPENKTDITGIIYEPWHYRFVGKYYANEIRNSGLCLEEYFEEHGWLDSDGKATDCLGPVEPEKTETAETTVPVDSQQTQSTSSQKVSIIA
jgi:D-alanyl-D-alanine carboxypeptidase